MIKVFKIYISSQWKYLLFLFTIFVIPLTLFYYSLNYPLPNIQFILIGALFFFQYFVYKDKAYQKRMTPFATQQLKFELGRVPARAEVAQRLLFISRSRGLSLILTAISILWISSVF